MLWRVSMTSEYENGPELFETPVARESEEPGIQKASKRVVRRRSQDASAQVVVKVKAAEPVAETTAEAPVEEPAAKSSTRRRGRPPRKTAPPVETAETPVAVQTPEPAHQQPSAPEPPCLLYTSPSPRDRG